MTSIRTLAAQCYLKAAMLNLLDASAADGHYMSAIIAEVSLDDGEAVGNYQIGGLDKTDMFNPFMGASL